MYNTCGKDQATCNHRLAVDIFFQRCLYRDAYKFDCDLLLVVIQDNFSGDCLRKGYLMYLKLIVEYNHFILNCGYIVFIFILDNKKIQQLLNEVINAYH